MTMATLPIMKPSELLTLALRDLAKVERNTRKYRVEMSTWHTPNGKCAVCFAGSVMAKSLNCAADRNVMPTQFDDRTSGYLRALNQFREGRIGFAFERLHRFLPAGLPKYIGVPYYNSANPKPFKVAMRNLITLLREHGE